MFMNFGYGNLKNSNIVLNHYICDCSVQIIILKLMSKGLAYFLGILTGIALTTAGAFVFYKASSSSGTLTMLNERGKMMDTESYMIIKTYDNNHALAVDSEILALSAFSSLIEISSFLNTAVYIIGNEKSSFYDGLEIQSSKKTGFYQVGTYRYKTDEDEWKTVPGVMLMKKQ